MTLPIEPDAPSAPSSAPPVTLPSDRPIVLVGLMGVGKSSLGRRLAARLDRRFVDADVAIEESAGMTITEMFARHGEASFRDGERRVIARLMECKSIVLATGGGAFVNDETRALILERGLALWLDADIATLVRRVGGRDGRPLLSGKDPAAVLTQLAEERRPAYAAAPIRISTDRGSPGVVVDRMVEAIMEYLGT